jgi:phenylalanyl-tRNA synthetase alpha chain
MITSQIMQRASPVVAVRDAGLKYFFRREAVVGQNSTHTLSKRSLHMQRNARAGANFQSLRCTPQTFLNIPGQNLYFRSSTGSVRSASSSSVVVSNDLKDYNLNHEECNVSPTIASRMGRNLHLQPNHPLNTIKTVIESYWKKRLGGSNIDVFDDLPAIVTTKANFDSLLIQPDHVSRSKSDTYYLNKETMLRTHTSAHQSELLQQGKKSFLVTGDVYRRDEIDSSHYPIFHQMEGVRVFDHLADDNCNLSYDEKVKLVEQDLKEGLEGMAKELFGDVEMRWVEAYFPFTDPSLELEIYYQDEWLEVLGCGVIQRPILEHAGIDATATPGWAFGLGLERLAMVLYRIPDIRLFWTDDERFHSQFTTPKKGRNVTFTPYSKYPMCYKDVSFWLSDHFHVNDFNEGVRGIAGDWVEKVELIDDFTHPKTNRQSHCYRISYRNMDRSLTNEEVDVVQEKVREYAVETLKVELR